MLMFCNAHTVCSHVIHERSLLITLPNIKTLATFRTVVHIVSHKWRDGVTCVVATRHLHQDVALSSLEICLWVLTAFDKGFEQAAS